MKQPPLLTAETATRILHGERRVTLDLGLSESRVEVEGSKMLFPGGESLELDDVAKISKRRGAVFFVEAGSAYQAAISGVHYLKLLPTAGAPTLEIDGIRMHRMKETTPDADTRAKLNATGKIYGLVLDTCMGLGYTACEAAKRGADHVVTVERDPNILNLVNLNPWSRGLYGEGVSRVNGDSFIVVDSLPTEAFSVILHDPPRLSLAGHLYGAEFYSKLHRLLKPGGRLYHYTGEPGSMRGIDLQRGVQKRLRDAGFRGTEYHRDVMAVTCEKSL